MGAELAILRELDADLYLAWDPFRFEPTLRRHRLGQAIAAPRQIAGRKGDQEADTGDQSCVDWGLSGC